MKPGYVTALLVFILVAGCQEEASKTEGTQLEAPPSHAPITTASPGPSQTNPPVTDKWSSSTPATVITGIFRVSPREAYDILQGRSGDPSFIVVDLRGPEERAGSRLPYGSMNIEYDAPDFTERLDELDRGRTYFVYCKADSRTPGALDIMADMGFRTVYGLEGGMVAWEDAGFEVER